MDKTNSEPWLSLPPDLGSSAELMERCENRLAARMEQGEFNRENIEYVKELKLNVCSGELNVSDELLERLRQTCRVWNVDMKSKEISSHRPIIGPLFVAAKKALFPIVHFFLKDTLRQQRDFNASVIRALAQLSQEKSRGKEQRSPGVSAE